MSTMKDLARIIASKNNLPIRDCEAFVSDVFETIHSGLSTDAKVKIKGLGTFKLQTVKQRESVDVNTGERVLIESHDRVSFTPEQSMSDSVNKPFSHFDTVILNEGVTFDDLTETEDSPKGSETTDMADAIAEESIPAPAVAVPAHVSEPQTPAAKEVTEPVSVTIPATGNTLPQAHTPHTAPSHPHPINTLVFQSTEIEDTEPMKTPEETITSAAENAVNVVSGNTEKPVTEPASIEENTTEEPATEAVQDTSAPKAAVIVPLNGGNTSEPASEDGTEDAGEQEGGDSENEVQPEETPSNGTVPPGVAVIGEWDDDDDDEDGGNGEWKSIVTQALLLLLIFVAGFFVGRSTSDVKLSDITSHLPWNSVETVEAEQVDEQYEMARPDSTMKKPAATATEQPAKTDTIKKEAVEKPAEKPAEQAKPAEQPASKSTETQKPAPAPKPADKAATEKKSSSNYDSDPRVRTGAYRIVGLAQTVTVGKGETLQKIAQRYLGPGMECYVEAYNGTTTAAEGQKIRIPKLELKKRTAK